MTLQHQSGATGRLVKYARSFTFICGRDLAEGDGWETALHSTVVDGNDDDEDDDNHDYYKDD